MRRPFVCAFSLAVIGAGCHHQQMARGTPLPPPRVFVPTPAPAEPTYWPTQGWLESTPESQGLSSNVLADALIHARTTRVPIHSLLVVRNGFVVLDAYFYPFERGARHDLASVTKSITSVLAGVAAADGLLPLSSRVMDALDRRAATDPPRGRIAIEHLLGMQSGLSCGFERNERELNAMLQSEHWIDFALGLPMRTEPGMEFGYCSPNYHLVSGAIGRAAHDNLEAFARKALFASLGITDVYWPSDPQGVTHGWGDLQLQPRDVAKIGLLYLHGGRWEGRAIVPPAWVARSTTPRIKYGSRNLYGYGWWTHPDSPAGFFEAIGRGGQRLSVWPEKALVVVMTGGGFEPGEIGAVLARAFVADSAIPADPIATRRLTDAISEIAVAPVPQPVSKSPTESQVSGRMYRVGANALGLRRFSLAFDGTHTATAKLELSDRTLSLPVGLDGLFRIADDRVDDVRPGARGSWRTPAQFILELDLIGKTDHYTLGITFAGDDVILDLSERTGLMRESFRGSASR